MIRAILLFGLIFLPSMAQSQAIKAPIDKQGAYLSSGKIQGGTPGDGKDILTIRFASHEGFERLVFDIHEWQGAYELESRKTSPPAAVPPYFQVSLERYPLRLVFEIHGVRMFSQSFPDFSGSQYIAGMHQLPAFADDEVSYGLVLKRPVEIEVFELHQPARLVVDLRVLPSSSEFPPVYSLRSKSSAEIEKVGILQEKLIELGVKDVRIIQDRDKRYFVEEGRYQVQKEALERKKVLADQGIPLLIEKRGLTTIPQDLDK